MCTQLRLCDLIVCVGHPDRLAFPKTRQGEQPSVCPGTEVLETKVMLCKNQSFLHSINIQLNKKGLHNNDLCYSENVTFVWTCAYAKISMQKPMPTLSLVLALARSPRVQDTALAHHSGLQHQEVVEGCVRVCDG